MLKNTCSYAILYINQLLFTKKRGITMEQVMRKFKQLNGKLSTITLEHCWFDKQIFEAQELKPICDDDRLGLVLRGQEIFVHRTRLCETKMDEHMIMFADDKLKILIKF